MKNLVTFGKNDREFRKYLEGTFSPTQLAIPVESLNVNTDAEMVTFKIIERSAVKIESPWELINSLFKLHKFIYFLFPIFYIALSKQINKVSFDGLNLLIATLAIGFLFVAINLMTDYWDHIKGLDRLDKDKQSKPILKGWVPAIRLKKISLICMGLSFLLSVPLVISFPKLLFVNMTVGLVLYLLLLQKFKSFRDYFLGEFFWALLVGPILSMGLELSICGQLNRENFFFGIVWGLFIFYRVQVNNFENILLNSRLKIKNIINYWGFDKSKNFILLFWSGILAVYVIFQYVYFHWLVWVPQIFILAYFSFKAGRGLWRLTSSVGSDLKKVTIKLNELFLLATMLWSVELIFLYLSQLLFLSE